MGELPVCPFDTCYHLGLTKFVPGYRYSYSELEVIDLDWLQTLQDENIRGP